MSASLVGSEMCIRDSCVAATQRLFGSHTGCVAATQGLLRCHNSILWLLRSHNSCVGCIYKLYMPVKQTRIRPENIESGTNGVGKPPFGLKVRVVRAVHLRMPPTCLDCQKIQKSQTKNMGFGDFRAPGPIGPYFRPISWCGTCAAGWRRCANYTCPAIGSQLIYAAP